MVRRQVMCFLVENSTLLCPLISIHPLRSEKMTPIVPIREVVESEHISSRHCLCHRRECVMAACLPRLQRLAGPTHPVTGAAVYVAPEDYWAHETHDDMSKSITKRTLLDGLYSNMDAATKKLIVFLNSSKHFVWSHYVVIFTNHSLQTNPGTEVLPACQSKH